MYKYTPLQREIKERYTREGSVIAVESATYLVERGVLCVGRALVIPRKLFGLGAKKYEVFAGPAGYEQIAPGNAE